MTTEGARLLPSARVAILGPGLIGGSLALALQRVLRADQLLVWCDAAEERALVSAAGLRVTSSLEESVQTDVVVLCVPVQAMPELVARMLAFLPARTTVTDAGSVKAPLLAALEPMLGARYVGAHPMAGSEKRGFAAARADLFDGARCFIVPSADEDRTRIVEALWKAAGCHLERIPAPTHDAIVARVSHLAHALAPALIRAAARHPSKPLRYAGPGLRDTTRLASSDPALWAGILSANRPEVLDALEAVGAEIAGLQAALRSGDAAIVEAWLAQARILREECAASRPEVAP